MDEVIEAIGEVIGKWILNEMNVKRPRMAKVAAMAHALAELVTAREHVILVKQKLTL